MTASQRRTATRWAATLTLGALAMAASSCSTTPEIRSATVEVSREFADTLGMWEHGSLAAVEIRQDRQRVVAGWFDGPDLPDQFVTDLPEGNYEVRVGTHPCDMGGCSATGQPDQILAFARCDIDLEIVASQPVRLSYLVTGTDACTLETRQ
jgi:hypothetical protein